MTELSEAYGRPLPERCRSTWEMFVDVVARYPHNLALACVHQRHDLFGITSQPLDDDDYRQKPYLRWSFEVLREAISRFVAGLKAAGVKPGMPIFTFVANGAEFIIAQWSAAEIGCVLVPINPRNLDNKEEVIHMIKTAKRATLGMETVVMVPNAEVAQSVDDLGLLTGGTKIIEASSGASHGWIPFANFMSSSPLQTAGTEEPEKKIIDGLVLFTSGTTSLPKGQLKQWPMFNSLVENALLNPPKDGMTVGSRFCSVLPNNHAMGFFTVLFAHTGGTAVVYPGATFQTDIMFETLYREKITQVCLCRYLNYSWLVLYEKRSPTPNLKSNEESTALVPTLVHALSGIGAASGRRLDHLVSVIFGGAVLTPQVLRTCINELGSKGAENAFGMTEGLFFRSGNQRDVSNIIDGEDVSIGWIPAGMGLRIADPDTNQILPRNALGELHCSYQALSYYIGDVSRSSFYNDKDGRLWFKTGDQARIDGQGRIFITGRYKDMIIRGGENMSPIAIEIAISKDPRLASMNPQVVAAPDTIAGEVPVAVVVGRVDADIRKAVQNAVLKNMGTLYVPDDVLSVQDLGLSDHPRTMGGKIKKTQLAALVKKYRDCRDKTSTHLNNLELAAEVQSIWAKAVGLEPSHLLLDARIGDFADSITVMRVRDMIKRRTGRNLSLVDMAKVGTVSGHISLLQEHFTDVKKVDIKRPMREGPPAVEDMLHLTEDPDLIEPTKELILRSISPYGLEWDDVEDVIPAYDYASIMTETRQFHSWGLKIGLIAKKADKTQLRNAIEVMFKNNRLLASFFVTDENLLQSRDSLHVAIRQTSKLFDHIFRDGGVLQTVNEVQIKALDSVQPPAFPGPLIRAVLYDIQESGTAGAVLYINHACADATSAHIFGEDLDRALGSSAPLHEHVDYKIWADSYYNLRTSLGARSSTKWHAKRLRDLGSHTQALWPSFTLPKNETDALVQATGSDVVEHSFDAPAIKELRRQNSILTSTVILKAAWALLNIHRTGHTHAVFSNVEAARTSFPFIPKAMEAAGMFEGTDVSGPTVQQVINLIEYRPKETVLSLLERMQEEQLNLTKYASAPLREVMSSLGAAGSMIPEIIGTQSFNWVPGMGSAGTNPHHNLEMLNFVVRPRQGLLLNAGMGGPDSSTVFVHLRGIGLDREGYINVAKELEVITLWLVAKENWTGPVGGYVAALKGADA
ncbi:AMP-binding enzyme [Xylariales sp. AK1849]|nr:AMP-binding enzyme [Xylariales sp. AK1849]